MQEIRQQNERNSDLTAENEPGDDWRSFSYGRMSVWIAVGLVIVWMLTAETFFFPSSASAAIVLGVFFFIDVATQDSRRYHGVLTLSYYCLALAYSVAASCLALFVSFTPPEPAARPAMSFWEELNDLLSGQWLADALGPALVFVILLLIHVYLFLGLTLISFLPAAVSCIRKRSRAAWLVLLNLPGMAFIGWVVYECLRESLLSSP